MTAPRDALAQLEAVLAKRQDWLDGELSVGQFEYACAEFIANQGPTLRALLGAADGVDVPEGWKLVPLEVTAAMEDAGLKWLTNLQHMRKQDRRNAIALAYEAMVNATLTKAPAND